LSWIRNRPAFPRDALLSRNEERANAREWARYDILVRTHVVCVRKAQKLNMSQEAIDRHIEHVDFYKADDDLAKKRRSHLLSITGRAGSENEDRKSNGFTVCDSLSY
jgi:hypothetical protein